MGILYKENHNILGNERMASLHLAFIHYFLNYGSIVWRNASKAKFKKMTSKQKQAVAFIKNNRDC